VCAAPVPPRSGREEVRVPGRGRHEEGMLGRDGRRGRVVHRARRGRWAVPGGGGRAGAVVATAVVLEALSWWSVVWRGFESIAIGRGHGHGPIRVQEVDLLCAAVSAGPLGVSAPPQQERD